MNTRNQLDIPQIGTRTAAFRESVIREMTRLGDKMGAVNLSQGLPDFDPPDELIATAVEAMRNGENQYTFPFGMAEFREAIAAKSLHYNRINADPATEITVTCGVSEALVSTVFALTESGDEVVILEPWYENYLPACEMAGVRPRFVPLREPDYTVDPDIVRAAINDRTRLIIVNTPHNPTGHVFSREELENIAALCQEFNVIAVTDEIYQHILYDGYKHISIGSLPGMADRTITISGLGKTYAVTGWRVGWAIGAEMLTAAIRKVHDYMTVCAPAPFQVAGITALNLPDSFYGSMRETYDRRRGMLLTTLRKAGFTFPTPVGAYYVMADFSAITWDEDRYTQPDWTRDRAFAEYMAREIGVAVVPGSSFYEGTSKGTSKVRFNFAKREATLEEAGWRMERLVNCR